MRALAFAAALLLPTAAAAVEVGDVVFSELMIQARSGSGEWMEIHAPGTEPVDLTGCFLRQLGESSQSEVLDGLVIDAGSYAVLSRTDPCVLYDAEGVCTLNADFIYDSVSLNNAGGEVAIECGAVTIDAVEHDWSLLAEECRTANAICSANLSPEAFSADGAAMATANDDWGSWCVPPASNFSQDAIGQEQISTAGAPNVCPAPGAVCGPGDVVFTEFMISAPNSAREWFEVHVTSPTGCDLQGCRLQEGPESDPSIDPTAEFWDFHTLDAVGNVIALDPGQYALFSRVEAEVGTVVGGGPTATAVNLYSNITFSDSEPGWLHLLCGGRVVDSAPYDWSAFEESCPAGGCSVGVVPIYETADENDHLNRWCIPPTEPSWETPEALPFRGTPGQQGACDARDWPAAGDVMFTELMVAPAGGFPEWFELADRGGDGYDLAGCRVERFRLDDSGLVDLGSVVDYVLGADDTAPAIEAGGVVVFGRDCINGAVREEGGECAHDEFFYESVSFGNSEAEFVDLYCPDGVGGEVRVDRAGYDVTSTGIRSGHSVQFDMTDAEPEANDSPAAWCEASFQDAYASAGGDGLNFGTPGVRSPCRTGDIPALPAGPGCQCGAVEPSASWLAALAILAVARRRRSLP